MADEKDIMKEWVLNYIKNRDLLTKNIISINENPEKEEGWDLIAETKTGNRFYLILPDMGDFSIVEEKLFDGQVTIVVMNTKKNLEVLLDNWDKLTKYGKLSLIFVNPDSSLDKKWVVFPQTHDRITEKESLKKGLKTLFSNVEPWK